jgi:hypothetical protein
VEVNMTLKGKGDNGTSVRESAKPGELQQLLAALTRRLDDARRPQNHPDTRVDQAYLAIHSCALVALRTEGLRPADAAGTSESILESLADTLRVDRQRIDTYRRLRSLRDKVIEEGALPAPRDVAEATEEAIWLSERLQRWIEDQDRVAPR